MSKVFLDRFSLGDRYQQRRARVAKIMEPA
jgi:hypothetical protein